MYRKIVVARIREHIKPKGCTNHHRCCNLAMMKPRKASTLPLACLALAAIGGGGLYGRVAVSAFRATIRTSGPSPPRIVNSVLLSSKQRRCGDSSGPSDGLGCDARSNDGGSEEGRRSFLSRALFSASSLPCLSLTIPSPADAASVPVQRAVGSAESKCREEGNCLELGELDGAVGWSWGGKDRCDASDPLCGPDGRLRDEPLAGKPVPAARRDDQELEITDVVELTLTIGTGSIADTRVMRVGLYGKECPELVTEMIDLCGRKGIVTSQNLLLGSPVRLGDGAGSVTYVRPNERIDFGVLSQSKAYAKKMRRSKAPDEFVPQPRPGGGRLQSAKAEASARPHDVAGLISVPSDGVGYGAGFGAKDDEAYASSFQITAAESMKDMDREGRKVIGQLLDGESMDLLARLAGNPIRKIVPTQNGGTPLIKVSVDDAVVYSVADAVSKE